MVRGSMLLRPCRRLVAHSINRSATDSVNHLSRHYMLPRPPNVRYESTSNRPLPHTTAQPYKLLARQAFQFLSIGLGIIITGHAFLEHFYACSPAEGISMLPTINSFGDWLVISKTYRRGRGIVVGDVVSAKHPVIQGELAVKRIIGMPGDLVIDGRPDNPGARMIQVPQGHCWIVGDNLLHSRDSRIYGPLPLALITGKVIARIETAQGLLHLKCSRIGNGLSVAE